MQNTDVRVDHTQHDVRQSAWTPADSRPRAGDPAAMVAAYARRKPLVVDDSLPTASAPTARCHEAYVAFHMRTCLTCRLHAAASLVTCRSVEEVAAWRPRPAPTCYMRWGHHSIRTGFEPSFDYEPAPSCIRNHPPTYADYPTTEQHLDQIDKIDVLSGGQAAPPSNAVVLPLLTVVRDKHRRKADKDGSIPKGRVAVNPTAPGVNDSMTPWPFQYDGVGAAVRLVTPGCFMGKIDLTKYFLKFAAGRNLQRFLWFSDPRHEPVWFGQGKPSPAWLRRKGGFRGTSNGAAGGRDASRRYKKYLGCPFGIKVMPAFASFISGEICRMLRSFGVARCVYYIDDLLIVADSAEECQRQMDLAMVLLRLLGLEPAEQKTEGPATTIDFLGVDIVDGDRLEISAKHLSDVRSSMGRMIERGTADRDGMLSLAGTLSWYALVLPGTRTFLRRIWDFIGTTPLAGAIQISEGALADMQWWCGRIDRGELRGSRIFRDDDLTEADVAADLRAADSAHTAYRRAAGDAPASESAGRTYCVDLCCGAGGFSLGARMANVFVLLAVDGCKLAIETYRAGMAAAAAEDAQLPGAANDPPPPHRAECHDVTDWRYLLELISQLPHRPQLLVASPPCQPFSTSGRGLAGDPRADVVASVVQLALAMRVETLLIENVPGFVNSPQFAAMCQALEGEYTIEWGVADAKHTAVPQARKRVFVTARRSKARCGMSDAAAALPSRGVCTLADALPDVRFAYHVARTSHGRCVVPATEPMQTLRTNCINGVNVSKYRPRRADAAPIGECTVLGAARLGVVQGFPADYPWPERRRRCRCKFCASSSVAAVSKQIGNAVPPRLAAWAIATALWRDERPPAQTGAPLPARPPLGKGLPRLISVKSDAAGDGRWCYVYDRGADGGIIVWSRLAGSDRRVHVPYFEMSAVYEAVMRHGSEWAGCIVRFGVDSSPVVNALNSATSRDPHLMRLLRGISDASIDFRFDIVSVHVTRTHNLLADQGTRHATAQDLLPYLAPEGFSAETCGDTVGTYRRCSQLHNGPISWLPLGPRQHSRSRPAPKKL